MKRNRFLKRVLLINCVFLLALSACMPTATPTLAPPTETAVPSTPTPQGRTLLVTSPADSGPATLRQAMQDAQSGDTITFDPAVFPPDGDRLFALWTNGVAVDDDPGVPSTLTFPNLSAHKVIGIDVLYGFQQELIIEMVNGNLVIRNLLIKDYPIILRLIQ